MKKTKRRILSLILSLVLVLSSIPALSLTAFAEDDEVTVTEAGKVSDLDSLKAALDADVSYIQLQSDIDFSTALTAEIGTLENGMTIDGNGFAFTNVSFDMDDVADHSGIFNVASGAKFTVKDLTVKGPEKEVNGEKTYNVTATVGNWESSNWKMFGVLCGNLNGSFDISNVDIYADVTHVYNGGCGIGGMFGQVTLTENTTSTITDCNIYGSVSNTRGAGERYAAGFVCVVGNTAGTLIFDNCVNSAAVTGGYATAGFISQAKSPAVIKIYNSVNKGDIDSGNGWYLAGFVGNQAANELYAENCVNDGKIGTIGKNGGGIVGVCNSEKVTLIGCVNNGDITGASDFVGGIAGIIEPKTSSTSATISIKKCVNNGKVFTGGSQTGGIVGCVYIATPASATVEVVACRNDGEVSADWKSGRVGGIIGLAYCDSDITIPVTDCINTGSVIGDIYVGGILGSAIDSKGTVSVADCANIGTVAYSEANEATATGIGYIYGYSADATVTNSVYYGATLNGAYSTGVTVYGITESDDALTALNAKDNGYFYLSSGVLKYCATPAPQFVGVQDTAVDTTDGTYDVRFIAVIDNADLSIYEEVGFKITATFSDNSYELPAEKGTLPSTVVFTSLLADGGMKKYSASELGGEYIIALSIKDMEAYVTDAANGGFVLDNGEKIELSITFTVTPYAVSADGAKTFDGEAVTFTYVAGEFTTESGNVD